MSEYEKACSEIPLLRKAIEAVFKSTARNEDGTTNNRNDKATLRFYPGQHIVNQILVEMGYGYHGSSSYYSCISERAIHAIISACNMLSLEIANTAIRILQQNIQEISHSAREEAKKILAECPNEET